MYFGIDIFSGAGGLSLGAEMAGIKMLYAVEVNPSAVKTYKRNHDSNTEVLQSDIRSIDPKDYIHTDKPIFIVMGGPPCQGFSLSNTRTRNMSNPNNMLFHEFVRFVDELKPSWFLFENVFGITNIDNGETIKEIEHCFRALGYENIASKVLWASDYGVPQHRNRFFMVGNRVGIKYEFPQVHHVKISVKEAIQDLPVLTNGEMLNQGEYQCEIEDASDYAKQMRKNSTHPLQNYVSRNSELVIKRYATIPQGGNWRNIPSDLMQNYKDKSRCHSGIYRRLRADEPSVVISNYRKSMLIHPTQDRGLSVREAARIQSFPDDFVFEGPISHIQQQIGNAVPPLLAKAVVSQIIKLSKEHELR
jgi:DNA (cytosine-5)-methyltransferase 1